MNRIAGDDFDYTGVLNANRWTVQAGQWEVNGDRALPNIAGTGDNRAILDTDLGETTFLQQHGLDRTYQCKIRIPDAGDPGETIECGIFFSSIDAAQFTAGSNPGGRFIEITYRSTLDAVIIGRRNFDGSRQTLWTSAVLSWSAGELHTFTADWYWDGAAARVDLRIDGTTLRTGQFAVLPANSAGIGTPPAYWRRSGIFSARSHTTGEHAEFDLFDVFSMAAAPVFELAPAFPAAPVLTTVVLDTETANPAGISFVVDPNEAWEEDEIALVNKQRGSSGWLARFPRGLKTRRLFGFRWRKIPDADRTLLLLQLATTEGSTKHVTYTPPGESSVTLIYADGSEKTRQDGPGTHTMEARCWEVF